MGIQKPRVLCVDDEPNILAGLRLTLRRRCDVTTAEGGAEALALLEGREERPFAVILSDMRMPGMDGAEFLARCREICPDSTRMLLTGYADLDAAVEAINKGRIFRFLTKPCPPRDLVDALAEGVEHHRLVTSEHVLLQQTLRGTIETLTEILALASPEAFGSAGRIKRWMGTLADAVDGVERWEAELAGMLSQIGAVALPTEVAHKVYAGAQLDEEERGMVAALPATTRKLLSPIPRLEGVVEMITAARLRYDGQGNPATRGGRIPLGGRLLRIAIALDGLVILGRSSDEIEWILGKRDAGSCDPDLVRVALEVLAGDLGAQQTLELTPHELTPGMILAEDARTEGGTLLLASGTEITANLLYRLLNVHARMGLAPLVVNAPEAPEPSVSLRV